MSRTNNSACFQFIAGNLSFILCHSGNLCYWWGGRYPWIDHLFGMRLRFQFSSFSPSLFKLDVNQCSAFVKKKKESWKKHPTHGFFLHSEPGGLSVNGILPFAEGNYHYGGMRTTTINPPRRPVARWGAWTNLILSVTGVFLVPLRYFLTISIEIQQRCEVLWNRWVAKILLVEISKV